MFLLNEWYSTIELLIKCFECTGISQFDPLIALNNRFTIQILHPMPYRRRNTVNIGYKVLTSYPNENQYLQQTIRKKHQLCKKN